MVMLKNKIGLNSNVKTLKNVILKKPKDAFKLHKWIENKRIKEKTLSLILMNAGKGIVFQT